MKRIPKQAVGSLAAPLVECIRDNIAVHGLAWTVAYYAKRMPRYELRFFMTAAYCY